MAINPFGISSRTPLECPYSLTKYEGDVLRPELTRMQFFNCNLAKKRLKLFDQILRSDWYRNDPVATFNLEEIKARFTVDSRLSNDHPLSQRLLTVDRKLNIEGLHGGSARMIQRGESYNGKCPFCNIDVAAVFYESTYLNRQLKFGKINISRWEIVQMKVEELADLAVPLIDALTALKDFVVNSKGECIETLSSILHSIDYYVEKFREKIQNILIYSLVFKVMCLALEKLGFRCFKKMHDRISKQLNTLLIIGVILFVWKALLKTLDKDPNALLIESGIVFIVYLLGYSGTLKLIVLIILYHLIQYASGLRNDLARN